jgi:hypothetical protein
MSSTGASKPMRLLPSVPVTDPAEQRATDGAHHEPGGEGAERREHGRGRVVRREEVRTDLRREEAEQGEVVPLEHVADHPGRDPPLHRLRRAELLSDHGRRDDRRSDYGHAWPQARARLWTYRLSANARS